MYRTLYSSIDLLSTNFNLHKSDETLIPILDLGFVDENPKC